ncbi:glycoside hydrolase [Amycolatopsis sp. NPDC051758]|uniref:glycoside hydrolase n=1 Tax=Amycolatopsis sp. NPDC051758 TaxID=3363935 RepID=UPI0037AC87F2
MRAARLFLRYAAQYGVPEIVGFVNSPPAAWTSNGKSCGGSLKSASTQAYATYLADIVTHFASEGVAIDHLSPMNEPRVSFSACNQEGMLVPAGQRDDIVRAVGHVLASRAPSTRVIADESDHVDKFLSEVPQWSSSAPAPSATRDGRAERGAGHGHVARR